MRKHITEIFPFLLPLRIKERNFFYQLKMIFDKNKYASKKGELLKYSICSTKTLMINENSGYDIKYQKNKVDNLKLASKPLNKILIYPEETFSFYKFFVQSKKLGEYKDGLILINGKIEPRKSGGLCQLSNMLYYLFLMTPLTIVERHGHKVKSLPNSDPDALEGIDATFNAGWLDLKVKNETNNIYQIVIDFDSSYMYGKILSNNKSLYDYAIENRNFCYIKDEDKIYEKVSVYKLKYDKLTKELVDEQKLYDEKVLVTYKLDLGEDLEMQKLRIACLFGGASSEYAVSLKSASAVLRNLDKEKYDITMIGITKNGDFYLYDDLIDNIENDTWYNKNLKRVVISCSKSDPGFLVLNNNTYTTLKVDLVFPILHGTNGEDGRLQGMLELAGLKYVGCKLTSSLICMDKYLAHEIASLNGILTPKSYLFTDNNLEVIKEKIKDLNYPIFVKPLKNGSSFGISKVLKEEDLEKALSEAFRYDSKIVIEENIEGFEVGCAILGNKELLAGEVDEIELQDGFFDYNEKYNTKTSKTHCPARLSEKERARIKKVALDIYKALSCDSFARVDMFYTKDKKIVFNEVNTIPGFTSHSRYPNMLKEVGLSFGEVLDKLIDLER